MSNTIDSLKYRRFYNKLIIKGFKKRIAQNLKEIKTFELEIDKYQKEIDLINITLKTNAKAKS